MKKLLLHIICTIVLLNQVKSQTYADTSVLRAYWLKMNGPNWVYPSSVTTSQKWFNTSKSDPSTWYNISFATLATTGKKYLDSLKIEDFMVPSVARLHYKNMSFSLLTKLYITDCPRLQSGYLDSLATVSFSLQHFTFTNNINAAGALTTTFLLKQTSLKALNLSNNNLSKELPFDATTSTALKSLYYLDLSRNKFSGTFNPAVFLIGTSSEFATIWIKVNNNLLTSIDNTTFTFTKNMNADLSYNLISSDLGFFSNLNALGNPCLYNFNVDLSNNKLINSQLLLKNWTFSAGTGSYIKNPLTTACAVKAFTAKVIPQYLGDTAKIDIPKPAAFSYKTNAPFGDYTIKYRINDAVTDVSSIITSSNGSGYFNFNFTDKFLQTYLSTTGDMVKVQPYIASTPYDDPSTYFNYNQVNLNPIYISIRDSAKVKFTDLDPVVCNGASSHKFRLDFQGFAYTDSMQITLVQNSYTGGVLSTQNYIYNVGSSIIKKQYIQASISFAGDSVTYTIKSVKALSGVKVYTSLGNNKTEVGLQKVSTAISSNYYCATSYPYTKVYIISPQNGVNYSITDASSVTSSLIKGKTDTLVLYPYFSDISSSTISFNVIATTPNQLCSSVIGSYTLSVINYESGNNDVISVSTPNCDVGAFFSVKYSTKDYNYVPYVNNFEIKGKTLLGNGATLSNYLPAYDFSNYTNNYVYVNKNHKVCGYVNSYYVYLDRPAAKTTLTTDSVAVVNFVNTTSFKPTTTNPLWYNRSIVNPQTLVRLPLRNWIYSAAADTIIRLVCGRVVEINLNSGYNKGDSIGGNSNFTMDLSTLTELRRLNIASNNFSGVFNSSSAIKSSKINSLNISYNNFTDNSFTNVDTAFKNTSINGQYNQLTFVSFLNSKSKTVNSGFFPQKSFDLDTTLTVKVGETVNVSNIIPDTKDGKMQYIWYKKSNKSVFSTTRDFKISSFTLADTGIYYCGVAHSDFTSISKQTTNAVATTINYLNVINLRVSACPTITVNAGNDTSVCGLPASVNLKGTSSVATFSPDFLWSSPNGGGKFSSPTSASSLYYPTKSDSILGTVNLILKATVPNTTCSYYDTLKFKINSIPKLKSAVGDTVCGSGSATLTATTFSKNVKTYWYTSATSTTPVATKNSYITPSITSTSNFYVQAVDSVSGCVNSTKTSVIALLQTQATASIKYSSSSFCTSIDSALVSFSGTKGGVFSGTAGLTVNLTTGAIKPKLSTAGSHVVTYTISAIGACSAYKAQFNVTINASPTDPAIPSIAGCSGTSFKLSSTEKAMGKFFWYVAATGGKPISNDTTIGVLSASKVYYLIDSNQTTTCKSNRVKVPITVYSSPSSAVISTDTTICLGGSATLKLNITGGTSPFTVYYNKLVLSNYKSGGVVVNPTSTTTYKLDSLVDANGCKASKISGSATVTLFNSLVISNTLPTTSINICQGSQITSNYKINATGSGLKYQWFVNTSSSNVGGLAITGATNSTYVPQTKTAGDFYYYCLVSDTCGKTAISNVSGVVKVLPSLTPQVNISASQTSICQNTSIVFSAFPVNGGTAPKFIWYRNGTKVDSSGVTYISTTNKANDSIWVQMFTSEACGTIKAVLSSKIKLNVVTNLVPSVKISTTSTSICEGTKVIYKATPLNGGLAPIYTWKINKTIIQKSSLDSIAISNLKNSDTVSVIVMSNASCLSVDSAISNKIVMTVIQKLTPKIVIKDSLINQCEGISTLFNTVTYNTGANPSYQWRINKDVQSNILNTFTTSSLKNNDTVSVVLTSSVGCVTSPTAVSNKVVVKIQTKVNPTITLNSLKTNICAKEKAVFKTTKTNSGTNPTYKWYVNNTLLSSAKGDSLVLDTLSKNASVYVTMLSSNTCITTTTEVLSNTLKLTVLSVNASVSIVANKYSACTGEEISITSSANILGKKPIYKWYINNNLLKDSLRANLNIKSLKSSDYVSLKLYPDTNCLVNNPVTSGYVNITFKDSIKSTLSIQMSQNSICKNSNVVFTATANPANTNGVFKWYLNNTIISNATTKSYTGTNLSAGDVVKVSYNLNETCADTTTKFVSSDPLISIDTLKVSASLSPNNITICEGQNVKITSTVLNGGAKPTYFWYINNSLLETQSATVSISNLKKDDKISLKVKSNASCLKIDTAVASTSPVKITLGTLQAIDIASPSLFYADSTGMASFLEGLTSKPQWIVVNQPKTWKGTYAQCGKIKEIRMPNSSLKGNLEYLDYLSNLEVLDLSNNQLIHTQYSAISEIAPQLRVLNLSNNQMNLAGENKFSYINNLNLDTLDLSYNTKTDTLFLTGKLPKYVKLNNLQLSNIRLNNTDSTNVVTYLNLSNNKLANNLTENTNSLFSRISGVDKLKYLNVSYNNLIGKFGFEDKCDSLEFFDISHNSITEIGSKAVNLTAASNLKYFDLGNNKIENSTFDADYSNLTDLTYFAVDSNMVSFTENKSGFRSLPKLPTQSSLILKVDNNHLDFNDLDPYVEMFKNTASSYSPQFDSIDSRVFIKPAGDGFVTLSTSLNSSTSTYQWKKLNSTTNLFQDLSLSQAKQRVMVFKFSNKTDKGKYTVWVSNTSFPNLVFKRRIVELDSCTSSFKTSFMVFDAKNCSSSKILMPNIANVLNGSKVVNHVEYWMYNYKKVVSDGDSLKVLLPGNYSYSVLDTLSKCLVISKDTSISDIGSFNPQIVFSNNKDSVLKIQHVPSNTIKYQWYVNDYAIAGAESDTLQLLYNGTYRLSIKLDNGCVYMSDELEVKTLSKTFVRNNFSQNSNGQVVLNTGNFVELAPNPANNYINIWNLNQGSKIEVIDVNSSIIESRIVNSNKETIHTTEFSGGIYLLRIFDKDKVQNIRFVIEK